MARPRRATSAGPAAGALSAEVTMARRIQRVCEKVKRSGGESKVLALPRSLRRAGAFPGGLFRPEQDLGVEQVDLGVPLSGALDEIPGAARAVAGLEVPERDQGYALSGLGEGVVEHPDIVALPNAVLRLSDEPARQLLRFGEHARWQLLDQAVEALAPVAAGRIH